MDKFILSRKSNYVAELIFNQNPVQDFDKKLRFFEIDHEMKWKLADNNSPKTDSCYICEKQRYCMIFYQRDKSNYLNRKGINKGLTEVTDASFIEKLRGEYMLKYSQMPTSL